MIKLFSFGLGLIGLGVAVTACTSYQVGQSARRIAGGTPYCIQVAGSQSDYRSARDLFDLSIVTMRARSQAVMDRHHAILVVGDGANPRLFHWSWRARKFIAGVLNERHYADRVSCEPQRDFVDRLPIWLATRPMEDYVRFSALEAYRIPKTCQAQWGGGSNPGLLIGTTAPDFLPLNRAWSDLSPSERDSNWVMVDWNPSWLLNLMKEETLYGELVGIGVESGLQKSTFVQHGRDSRKYTSYRYLAYADDRTPGVNTTLITCGIPTERFPDSCQHRFLNKGRHFYFRHRPQDVPA